jgi:hypothetical protein
VYIVCLLFYLFATFSGLVQKDDMELLKAGFQSQNAGLNRQAVILRKTGARFSVMNLVAGWLPSTKSALDFMHCIFLGALHVLDHVSIKS